MTITTNKVHIYFDQPKLLQLDEEIIDKIKQLKVEVMLETVKLITNMENEYFKLKYKKKEPC